MTKRFDLQDKYDMPMAIALGFFDCIHIGHAKLIAYTKEIASSLDINSALLTFSNDPNIVFGKSKQIYNFDNRALVVQNLGIDCIISSTFDDKFMSLAPNEFLDILTTHFNIKHIIVGADYTFGKGAKGDVEYLTRYCEQKGIVVNVIPFEEFNGEKLSTRNLKSYVTNGNVKELNDLLTEPYFVTGIVAHERHKGTEIGYPTANIIPSDDRLPLASGIYATRIVIDNVTYDAMTNVGIKPTFDDNKTSIETHIFDFSGDVYNRSVKVQFIERTRDIIRFSAIDDLKTQLSKDEKQIREILSQI